MTCLLGEQFGFHQKSHVMTSLAHEITNASTALTLQFQPEAVPVDRHQWREVLDKFVYVGLVYVTWPVTTHRLTA